MSEVKGHIREYEKLNIKPAAILIALREKIEDLPTKMQVNNYLKTLRNKKELDGRLGNLSCLKIAYSAPLSAKRPVGRPKDSAICL